jgi:hypothetical protein
VYFFKREVKFWNIKEICGFGFQSREYRDDAWRLLGCDIIYSGGEVPMFRRNFLCPFSGLKITYFSVNLHLLTVLEGFTP